MEDYGFEIALLILLCRRRVQNCGLEISLLTLLLCRERIDRRANNELTGTILYSCT
jgi:hypothetical protein